MLLEIKSVRSVIDTETKMVYPMNCIDNSNGVHLNHLDMVFVDSISDEDIIMINENLK